MTCLTSVYPSTAPFPSMAAQPRLPGKLMHFSKSLRRGAPNMEVSYLKIFSKSTVRIGTHETPGGMVTQERILMVLVRSITADDVFHTE